MTYLTPHELTYLTPHELKALRCREDCREEPLLVQVLRSCHKKKDASREKQKAAVEQQSLRKSWADEVEEEEERDPYKL
jgi:hypothetical protein